MQLILMPNTLVRARNVLSCAAAAVLFDGGETLLIISARPHQ